MALLDNTLSLLGRKLETACQERVNVSPGHFKYKGNNIYGLLEKMADWSKRVDLVLNLTVLTESYLYLKYQSKDERVKVINGEVFFRHLKIKRTLDFSEIMNTTQ